MRPRFAHTKPRNEASSFRFAPGNKRGSGAPKGALSSQCPRIADKFAHTGAPSSATRPRALFRGHARLPALTLAAFATGYYPDGSAPEPGFPKPQARRCFACLHSSLRLSALRADRSLCRSTGAPGPPGSGSHFIRARAPHSLRLPKVPSRKAPFVSEVEGIYSYL